jgi:predicted transcriptional regulator
MPKIDDGKKSQIPYWLSVGKSKTEVARMLGISRDSVNRYSKDLKTAQKIDLQPPETAQERAERIRQLSVQRDLLKSTEGEQSFRWFLESLLHETVDRLDPPPKYKKEKCREEKTEETMVALWSDWHYGELVKAESVQGLNEYNPDIASARVYSLVQKTIGIKNKLERGGWNFPRLVIALNGDMITGSIHELEKSSSPNNIVLASYQCARLLALAIRDLAAEFESVTVISTSGNHGRLDSKSKSTPSKEPLRNWDSVVYLNAMTALENVKNVEFLIPDSYTAVFEVEGYTFAQNHGHDIKAFGTVIPIYGFNRMVSSLNSIRVCRSDPINYFLFSHYHSASRVSYAGSEYMINGSLIGATEYGVNSLGKADKPCQLLFGVHRDHGITSSWNINPKDDDGMYEVPTGVSK